MLIKYQLNLSILFHIQKFNSALPQLLMGIYEVFVAEFSDNTGSCHPQSQRQYNMKQFVYTNFKIFSYNVPIEI